MTTHRERTHRCATPRRHGRSLVRRHSLHALVALCVLVCAPALGASSASAGPLFGTSGEGAGQVGDSEGIAVDRATGDVYVSDRLNRRIDKFDGSGGFLLAWGWGVSTGVDELQTCTTSCRPGLTSPHMGVLCGEAVAVDNDPLSLSYGDVYVVICGRDGYWVQKFDPTGKFLLELGGHVNETTGTDICLEGETCGEGTAGAGTGEFELESERSVIATGPAGALYVGDRARVQVFEPSGAWRESISLVGLSPTGKVTALAVNAAGDVFIKDSGVPGVHELEPNGTEVGTQFDEGSTSVASLSTDAAGDLFVSQWFKEGSFQEPCACEFSEYSPSGKELERFGMGQVEDMTAGMVWDEALGEVLQYGWNFPEQGRRGSAKEIGVWGFPLPPPGPVVEAGSESVSPGLRGAVAFEALVNPEDAQTAYRFEYVGDARFQANGYAGAKSTASASLPAGFDAVRVSVHVNGLAPGETYHYRIVASNANGTATEPDRTFAETPAALIDGPWVSNVASGSATLAARIDPLGASTEYRFEYGTSASYGHTIAGNVGAGENYLLVSSHQQELQPGTLYHYRLVTVSEVGTIETADRTFTTQTTGEELTLLDGRGWELVSPSTKNGALIEPRAQGETMMQASEDGEAITYLATNPAGSNIAGSVTLAQLLSRRGPGGWSTQDVESSREKPAALPGRNGQGQVSEDRFFSPDLSSVLVEPVAGEGEALLSPEASEPTVYLRNNDSGTYRPLLTSSNVAPGTRFGLDLANERGAHVVFTTPDLSHVILRSPEALTEEAKETPVAHRDEAGENLFEWYAGKLQLVNVLPDGEASDPSVKGAYLARDGEVVSHSVSADGRRVIWELGLLKKHEGSVMYMRDMTSKVTVQIGEPYAMFQTASTDGSEVFFNQPYSNSEFLAGDLKVYEAETGTTTVISKSLNPGEPAGVATGLMGASEDGSYVYFVATGVLAPGASSDQDNLYVAHHTGSEWAVTFIATLSSEDERSWVDQNGQGWKLTHVSSRVSPSGRYVAFMSQRSLTGYDNIDAISGQPDEEVYMYDATTSHVACVSCDPTGARPVGVFDHPAEAGGALVVDRPGIWTSEEGETANNHDHWLAGSIPGWGASVSESQGFYQPRYLSDSGRLYFDSPVGLVPQDTNGLEDVYEYEPAGVGNCTVSSTTWVEREGGCVNLLTAGTSGEESAFYDASSSGDDVFFITTSKLVSSDYDSSFDLYDAHVCTSVSPCVSAPVSPPECTTADSCKPAPAPQPGTFGNPASATFEGRGNVTAPIAKPVVKGKRKAKPHKTHRRRKHKAKKSRFATHAGSGRSRAKGRSSTNDRKAKRS